MRFFISIKKYEGEQLIVNLDTLDDDTELVDIIEPKELEGKIIKYCRKDEVGDIVWEVE